MKSSVWLLLMCSIALVARSVCQSSQSTFPFPPLTDEKIRSTIEQLVAKVDNLQQKFVELRCQLQEHRQHVAKIREDHDKTLAGILMIINRLDERLGNDFGSFSVNFELMQNQTLEILAQQSECASHVLFRERVFKYLPQQNQRSFQKQASVTTQSRLKPKPPSQRNEDSITSSTRLPEDSTNKTTATPSQQESDVTPIAQIDGLGSIPVEKSSEKLPPQQIKDSFTSSLAHPEDLSVTAASQQGCGITTTGHTPIPLVNETRSTDSENSTVQQIEISVTSASRLPEDSTKTTTSQQESDILIPDSTPILEVNAKGSIPLEQINEKSSTQQFNCDITSSLGHSEESSETTTLQQENIFTIPDYEGSGWDISLADCDDEPSKISGPYLIRCIYECVLFTGYCEQQAFGCGWHVVQYRFDGSLDFQRSWAEYRDGFGDINREFWIGLEKLHQLTSSRPCELVIEIKDFRGNYAYARYDAFEIGDEGEQYRLKTLGQYNGTAGDSMAYHRGMRFSTLDRDNDEIDENCAQKYTGAWWYKGCYDAHLNGRYMNARNASAMGWYRFKSSNQGLSYSRMMVRSVK